MVSDILPDIVYNIPQAGFLPPLDKEAAGIITVSEAIFKEFATKHSLNARRINSFIKDELKNPAFNAVEVDTDMLQRLGLQASIDSGDVQIINMHAEGGGEQVLDLFRRPVEKFLLKLMADMRLTGSLSVSTLDFKSTRTRVATDFLQGNHMAQYLFNWPN